MFVTNLKDFKPGELYFFTEGIRDKNLYTDDFRRHIFLAKGDWFLILSITENFNLTPLESVVLTKKGTGTIYLYSVEAIRHCYKTNDYSDGNGML